MAETIYFNGRKYESVSDMPSSVRRMYVKFNHFLADDDYDGIPDFVQSGGLSGLKETFNMVKDLAQYSSSESFNQEQFSIIRVTDNGIYINGKGYNNIDEMPDEVLKIYHEVVQSATDGKDDIYDESWRQVDRDEFFNPHDDETLNTQFNRRPQQRKSTIETVDSNNRFIFLIAVAILILGALFASWFLFF